MNNKWGNGLRWPFNYKKSAQPEFNTTNDRDTSKPCQIIEDGVKYSCQTVQSENGRWRLSYGLSYEKHCSRIFRSCGDEIIDSIKSERPFWGSITNDGISVVLEGVNPDDFGGRIRVFDGNDWKVMDEFHSNIRSGVLSKDGKFVAVATLPSDSKVYQYSVSNNKNLSEFKSNRINPFLLDYHENNGEDLLYVAEREVGDPYVGLSPYGDIVWQSKKYRTTQPITKRMISWANRFRDGIF